MEALKAYVVTKGSSDGTLTVGDKIWLSKNGDFKYTLYGRLAGRG